MSKWRLSWPWFQRSITLRNVAVLWPRRLEMRCLPRLTPLPPRLLRPAQRPLHHRWWNTWIQLPLYQLQCLNTWAPAPAVTYSVPASVFEYVAPAPVFEFAPASAGSFVAPSQQLRPAYTAAAVTTGVNLDADVVGSASEVVGSLPHGEVFAAPVFNQVHQEQLAGGEIPENLVEIPVVHKQVIVQDIPEVIVPLPPAQESSAPVYGQVQQVIVGMRPERLVDARGPQRCVRTVPSVTSLPPLPDLCRGDVHDATLVKFLLRQTLLQRKKEEEERKKEEEEEKEQFLEQSMQELRLLSKTPGRSLQQTNRMMELLKLRDAASSSTSKRKRKKRRKKKLPRGRARRRLRQRHVQGWFFFLALCSLWLQTGPDARHHGRYDQEGWFLSTAPRIWQSLVRCSLWFDSGYMLRQSTAAFVGGAFRIQSNAWFDSGFAR